jgi:lipoate-protein ligase A
LKNQTSWRLILSPPQSGAFNMALDEAVFSLQEESERPGRPVLRFYTWAEPTLTIGYSQKITRAADVAFCERNQIPIVRRPTGGRAVLHAAEYTYSLVSAFGEFPFTDSLIGNYRKISDAFSTALRGLGVKNRLVSGRRREPQTLHTPCFASAQVTEVISANGKKIIGSAQLKGRRAFLQQGSILLEVDRILLSTATGSGHAAPWMESFAGLRELSAGIPSFEAFGKTVAAAFSSLYGVPFEESAPLQKEMERALTLEKEKYSQRSWNFRR